MAWFLGYLLSIREVFGEIPALPKPGDSHTCSLALEMSRQEDQELKVILAMQRIQSQPGIQETLSQRGSGRHTETERENRETKT